MPLIGRFYFKRTVNGNLVGEYSSNHPKCTRSLPESACRLPSDLDTADPSVSAFVGEYLSSWAEEGRPAFVTGKLRIAQKHGCDKLFEVTWRRQSGNGFMFIGEAMLCGDVLLGDYREPSVVTTTKAAPGTNDDEPDSSH